MLPPPVVIGLVVCDYVHFEDGDTRKVSLIGGFAKLAVREFPATPEFCAYAALTDAFGEATITVEVEGLGTGEILYTRESRARFPGKLDVVHVSIRMRHCTFPAAGNYAVKLLIDRELLAQRRIEVYQR